jgi:HEPN domain-containing protein
MRRYKDWLKQAKADLEVARDSLKAKHYEGACFQAQQSTEKATKALAEKKGQKKFRHSISYILKKYNIKRVEGNWEVRVLA